MAEVQPLNSLFVTACELYGSHGGEKDDAYDILRSIIGERKNMNLDDSIEDLLNKHKKVAGYLVRNDFTDKTVKEVSELISEIVKSKLDDDDDEDEEESQKTTEIKEEDDEDEDDEDFNENTDIIIDNVRDIIDKARVKMSSDVRRIGRFGLCQAFFGGIVGGSFVLAGFVAGHLVAPESIVSFLPFNCSLGV